MQQKYSRNALVAHIVDSLESGANVDQLAKSIAAYLIDINKLSELDSVMRAAQELRAQKYGLVELDVRTAHQLGVEQEDQIKQAAKRLYPDSNQVTMHEIIDTSVVGGVNLTFPEASLDITIRSKLNQLREAIS